MEGLICLAVILGIGCYCWWLEQLTDRKEVAQPIKRPHDAGDIVSVEQNNRKEVAQLIKRIHDAGGIVLTRKKNESIVINNNITIVIVDIRDASNSEKSTKVRIGVEAPKEIPVHRKEVYDEIQDRDKEESNEDHIETDDAG